MNHQLKITDERLENLISGRKKAEVRLNDRDYQLGDTIEFHRMEGVGLPNLTKLFFTITHIHSGLGLQDGYVILSVEIDWPTVGISKPLETFGDGK